MKKNILISFIFILMFTAAGAQSADLPLKEWTSAAQTPFVFYISGDGGFNDFSTDLCKTINKAGYGITALSAKSYFWDKKTPEQTAKDIATYLEKQFQKNENRQLVLAGYSFGADVLPFIVNKLSETIKKRLISVVLLAPSTSTDFEIHWSDMLGSHKKRSMDVVVEINRMGLQKTATIFGSDEDDFPVKDIRLKNYSNENLPGSHHFDGNTDEVAKTMIKYFK
jgi:type IV secretory pathway VirJ component